jgi:putative membrane protein
MHGVDAPAEPERLPERLRRPHGRWRAWPTTGPARALLAGAGAVAPCWMAVVWLMHLGPLSAHMAQHIALMNVLAPIGAVALMPLLPDRKQGVGPAALWAATCAQIVLLWAWHAPALHAAAASGGGAHGAMLATLLAVALCFWGAILLLSGRSRWQGIVALLLTGKLACLLGALLVFAPRPLYASAAGHHAADSLQDQHLAGLLMIAACPLSYVLVGVVLSAQLVYGLTNEPVQPASPKAAASR